MKTGEPVESLSLSKILVLYMRKYLFTYGKTGWEIYIHILYQNMSLGPDEDRRTCWKLVSLQNFSPVHEKIPIYICWKTGWEIYIHILYQNMSLGPDEDRRTCWKLVSLQNFSPVHEKIPIYIWKNRMRNLHSHIISEYVFRTWWRPLILIWGKGKRNMHVQRFLFTKYLDFCRK